MRVRILASAGVLAAIVKPLIGAAHAQAPADSTAAPRRALLYALPVVSYAPETGWLGGLIAGRVGRPADALPTDRPASLGTDVAYTEKRQFAAGLEFDRWSRGNRWHVVLSAGASRFPTAFHGIGREARDTAERYTPRAVRVRASLARHVGRHVYLGGEYSFRDQRMIETEPSGLLAPGTIAGSRGGTVSSLGVSASWDSRDAIYWVVRGSFVRVSVAAAGEVTGSDFGFRRVQVDARRYIPLSAGRVLAAQVLVGAVWGTVPFDLLLPLSLRGYAATRYLDRATAAAQMEYRSPVVGRLRMVAFAGAGAVAPRLDGFAGRDVRAAGGLGLRYLISRAEGINLRVDVAFGRHGTARYVGAGEAF